MANIGPMPTALELLATATPRGDYGEHLEWTREADKVHLVSGSEVIATASDQAAHVYLERLQPLLVPYVNAFIEHTGKRVEKYWRTKQYREVPLIPAGAVDALKAVNVSAAKQLGLLTARTVSDADQVRALASVLLRAAEALDREEAQRLSREEAKLVPSR